MEIRIIGRERPIHRIVTGLYSFDRAFVNRRGDLGFPVRGICEVSGFPGIGKSTFCLSLSGMLATSLNKNIVYSDIEGFDPDTMVDILSQVGYSGDLKLIDKTYDEDCLDDLITTMIEEKYGIGIFDSIGAVSPMSEVDGDMGEANWGRRARLLAQFSRKFNHTILQNDPNKTVFMTNHLNPNMGGRGYITPGGMAPKFLATTQIRLKRVEEFPDGSYALEGSLQKNRFGRGDQLFYVVVLAGKGVHKGLSALFDGYKLKVVNRSRVVKIGNDSYGYLKDIFEKAHDGDDEFFAPFYKALEEVNEYIGETREQGTSDSDSE